MKMNNPVGKSVGVIAIVLGLVVVFSSNEEKVLTSLPEVSLEVYNANERCTPQELTIESVGAVPGAVKGNDKFRFHQIVLVGGRKMNLLTQQEDPFLPKQKFLTASACKSMSNEDEVKLKERVASEKLECTPIYRQSENDQLKTECGFVIDNEFIFLKK